jgi:uncharacterized membrane protein YoaK (UPF0700 family)
MSTNLFSSFMAMFVGAQQGNVATEVCNLLVSPWVHLALIAIPCIIFVVGRRYNMLVAFLSIPACVCILRYTTENISVPDCYAEKLPVFVGGFLVIGALNVYYHVVKN